LCQIAPGLGDFDHLAFTFIFIILQLRNYKSKIKLSIKVKNNDKMKPAKLCYEHIGGKLGQLLLEALVKKGWLAKTAPNDKNLYITELGESQLTAFGIDLSQIKS